MFPVGFCAPSLKKNNPSSAVSEETHLVQERYERRKQRAEKFLYDPLNPTVYMSQLEKERALIEWISQSGLAPVSGRRVLEIGCGSGGNLLEMIRLGFAPENLVGNELLAERAAVARHRLPDSVAVTVGDALALDMADGSFDVVFQSLVFTSILDDDFRRRLAGKMWSLTKPGGGVLWYDFIYDNPRNRDVRGVPLHEIRQLFPEGELRRWRITLAPPISRLVTRVHPVMYSLFNLLPFLRTHVLCWITKTCEMR